MRSIKRRSTFLAPLRMSRALPLLVALALLLPAIPIFSSKPPAGAAASLIKMPFASGANWSVLQGYNTAPTDSTGGSHYNCDPVALKDAPSHTEACKAQYQYRYSLDLLRADGSTAGQTVLAPVNGTVRWRDDSTGGLSINLGNGYAFAFFHVNVNAALQADSTITQGQPLGTIAAGGQANNGGTPHIHVTLWQTTDGGNWNRTAVPFTGAYALDGYDLPDKGSTAKNQYVNQTLVSSNVASVATPTPTATATQTATAVASQTPGAAAVPAAPAQTSPASGVTFPYSGVAVTFTWTTVAGATKYQLSLDGVASGWLAGTTWTSGPLNATGQHQWKIQAMNASGAGAWSPDRVFWIDSACSASTSIPPSSTTTSLTADAAAYNVNDCAILTGKGFTGGESVAIYLDSTTSTAVDTVIAAANGSFYDGILAPELAGGSHTFIAKGVTSGRQGSVAFSTGARLTRDPYSGPSGAGITITGHGFGPNETVNITFTMGGGLPNITLGSFTSNPNGYGVLQTAIPEASNGWHDYSGLGVVSHLYFVGAIYVERNASVSPSTGAPGAAVVLKATGFPGSTSVSANWNGGAGFCPGSTQANGNYACSFTVPANATAGSYPVTLTTASGASFTAQMNVTGPAAISLSSTRGRVSSLITIAGGGFKANSNVAISWKGAAWFNVTTNSGGGFSYPVTIPATPDVTNTIAASGVLPSGAAVSKSATFTIDPSLGDTGSSMTSYGTFIVTATEEGLVGGTTSNDHVITPYDHFVSLPSCTTTSCPTWYTGPTMTCGAACYVRVTNPSTNQCSVAPVYDVGPWFTNDNWWDPAADRKLNAVSTNPNYLAQGYPGTVAVYRDGLDVGYGPGVSNVNYRDGNYAAIDLADGTWVDIGLNHGAGIASGIQVTMLWLTGENYRTAMASCGQTTGTPTIAASPSAGVRIGTSISVTGNGFAANETVSIRLDSASATVLGSSRASSAGAVSITIALPAAVSGAHTLFATGSAGGAARTGITVAPSITAPGSTTVNAPITVTGAGFASGETVSIRWGSTTAGVIGTATANTTGGFSVQVSLGAATSGPHTLYATTTSARPSTRVTIIPDVKLSASSGPSYQNITVSVTGFKASEVVSFAWGTQAAAGSATTDSRGSATFLVRTPRVNGLATGTATGATSGLSVRASYTVIQSLALAPATGSPGTAIAVTGLGWNVSAAVTVYFNRTATSVGTTFCTATTDVNGSFGCSGKVPGGTANGSYVVMGGSGALTASAPLSVASATGAAVATVSFNPTSGFSYSRVTVQATGFGANETVNLNWDSTVWGANPAIVGSGVTDANGAVTFKVRSRNAGGLWTGTVTGATSKRTAKETFTVNPSIKLSAAAGSSGSPLTVNGNGWTKTQVVSVTIVASGASTGPSVCSVTTSSVGKFSCTANLPASLKTGSYTIVATIGALRATAPFSITAAAVASKAVAAATPSPTGSATEKATLAATPIGTPASPSPAATVLPTVAPTHTPTVEVPTETATPAPIELPPTDTPTPDPTVAPEPQTTVINSIAAASAAGPSDPSTPIAAIDPGVELLAGGALNAVAAVSFDVESIGSGALVSATLVLTGGGDGAGTSTGVSVLPGYVVDPATTDVSVLPLDQAAAAVSASGASAQFVSDPGVESALDVTGSITADGVVTFFISGPPDQVLAIAGAGSSAPPRLEIVVQPAG